MFAESSDHEVIARPAADPKVFGVLDPSDREVFAESESSDPNVFAESRETESSEQFAQSESSDTDSKTPLNPCFRPEDSVKFKPLPCKLYQRRIVNEGATLNLNLV